MDENQNNDNGVNPAEPTEAPAAPAENTPEGDAQPTEGGNEEQAA